MQQREIIPDTHVKINVNYMGQIVCGRYYSALPSHIVNILLVVVYFSETIKKSHGVLEYAIIAGICMWLIELLIMLCSLFKAFPYYGQIISKTEADNVILFLSDCSIYARSIFCVIFQIPTCIIAYFFFPFSKTVYCNLYSNFNCELIRTYCVVESIGVIFIIMTSFFMLCIFLRDYSQFTRDALRFFLYNIVGIFIGNLANIKATSEI